MSQPLPITSLARRGFEDYVAGSVYEFGAIKVDEAEVVSFAERFDPQPFHTDPQVAERSSFGGLIASGWHTAGLASRLVVDHFLPGSASMGSPGVDELRWVRPVRPGDELSIRTTITETRPSHSKPDRGLVHTFIEVLNQNGEVALGMKLVFIMQRVGAGLPTDRE